VALASFLILLVVALIGSCAKPYHAETEKYYFVATNINLRTGRKRRQDFGRGQKLRSGRTDGSGDV